VDQLQFAANAEDIRHFNLLGVRAGREDGEVRSPEPEQPVPEHVVPMALKYHPTRIEYLLPFPNFFPHPEPAPREDHVFQAVNEQEHDQPDGEEKQRNGEVAQSVDVNIDDPDRPKD
jgi:hypothetical protein